MQPSSPSSKMRVSSKRLVKLLARRKASFDSKRSDKTFGCRSKVEDLEVDPSSSFVLNPLDDAKLCPQREI